MSTPEIVADVETTVREVAQRAKEASARLATLSAEARNTALERMAVALERDEQAILTANATDVAIAQAALARGEFSQSLLDRLILDPVKLRSMAAGIRAVAALDDPIGAITTKTRLDQGLELHRVTVPLGVIAAIFEARPDAVTQIAALALKSGNAVLLKGGSEALYTTRALVTCLRGALVESNTIPPDAICAVEQRASVDALLALDTLIDLVVPRGSNALVRMVQSRTRIPVLGHAEGVCHVYVDRDADPQMAVEIVVDSKVQYPAACNAAETVLLDTTTAPTILPALLSTLTHHNVEVRGCPRTLALVTQLAPALPIVPATDADWGREYGERILACKLVDTIDMAITHINQHGSGHTDAIVTANPVAAAYFLTHVDSASVFHNASTRFADGYRFGFGAEVGISTGKLHARGPVGLSGLTTYKYLLHGHGHLVAPYTGPQARPFLHEKIHENKSSA
ncbi:MAG TPA: glutamate-5-semialdehyde dehydrogenase [Gemmatimonadaceae bacterium]|nr:glutamate-5-semialdehyde dehydrogenase [Gemmatimonadaceae bacterium]